MEERIEKLTKLLWEWNRHEWRGKERSLLYKIWNLFEKECLEKQDKKGYGLK